MTSVENPPPLPSTTITAAAATATATAAPPSVQPATTASPVKPEVLTPLPPPSQPSLDTHVSHNPSYSGWFSWNSIHECEVRSLPEFFDSRSPSKNPRVYKYFRDSIIKYFRRNSSSGKISFTEVRKTLVGDVGSIRRVFDFLEAWGLINYMPNPLNKPLKWDDKDSKSSASGDGKTTCVNNTPPKKDATKRLCNGCQSVCTFSCFFCDKHDLTLCARCFVRGNYRVGVSSKDFRRVEISEEIKSEWSEKETLQLLEAIMHFGDEWKKVALHVPGRSEKDCVAHFIKLPVREQFNGYTDLGEMNKELDIMKDSSDAVIGSIESSLSSKRMRLTPLADASNPIMGQAAFLSALAGGEVAGAAARAAVDAFNEASEVDLHCLSRTTREHGAIATSNRNADKNGFRRPLDTNSLHERGELDAERAISRIVQVQMKEIQNKIVQFEELDLLMEKEWQQLEQLKNLLFVDQLTLLFHKNSTPGRVETNDENVRTD